MFQPFHYHMCQLVVDSKLYKTVITLGSERVKISACLFQIHEEFRTSNTEMSLEKLLNLFIETKHTGNERPGMSGQKSQMCPDGVAR